MEVQLDRLDFTELTVTREPADRFAGHRFALPTRPFPVATTQEVGHRIPSESLATWPRGVGAVLLRDV